MLFSKRSQFQPIAKVVPDVEDITGGIVPYAAHGALELRGHRLDTLAFGLWIHLLVPRQHLVTVLQDEGEFVTPDDGSELPSTLLMS